jgi:Uma2 family endonuclease
MNIQARYPTTADEFLRWNEGREGKREFVRGRVVEMMINTTRNHARIAADLLVALRTRLDRAVWDVGSADFGVVTPAGVRYPDVYVDRRGPQSQGGDLAATEPVILAEILSASSYGRDFVEKLSEYQAIPSLRHYLILSQDDARAWLWSRMEGGGWSDVVELAGTSGDVRLSGVGIELPMSELYASAGLDN